jgi:hypothetical protein
MSSDALAIDAELALGDDTDPRAPGGEVSVALCGHWEHEGPCRWPHNTRIDTAMSPAHLRTVIVVPEDERAEVLSKVEFQLRQDPRWSVMRFEAAALNDDERELAERLAQAT